MESPSSPNASSVDTPLESPIHEDKDKVTYVRILVSNTAAGCIIGKGGSTISEFQSQSGARIQLSRSQEYFPGTSERIILISGAFDQIIKALELICEKLLAEVDDTGDVENTLKVKLIVPNSCCGGIIGKGGAIIKSLIEDSHAGIKISPQDQTYAGLTDRIVTLSGTLKEQMWAFDLILSKLAEDSHYSHFINTPYPYAGTNMSGFHGTPVGYMVPTVPYNPVNYGTNGNAGKYSNNKAVRSSGGPDGAGSSVTIGVADEHIGAVLGRGGKSIMEITQASGARIKISDRGDFMTGTSDRKVIITGSQEAIRTAESLIMQKVSSNSER